MSEKARWGQYERMRPDEIEIIFEKYPIAYMPWGASEYHGVHNPVGLDSIKAYGMSVEEYKTNNVLKTEINSENVAELVCAMAGKPFAKTTGAQVAIDGGSDRII